MRNWLQRYVIRIGLALLLDTLYLKVLNQILLHSSHNLVIISLVQFVGDPILKAASKKIGDLVDGISDFYHKLNPGDDDYILPSDNNGKSDLERAQELTKFNVETEYVP